MQNRMTHCAISRTARLLLAAGLLLLLAACGSGGLDVWYYRANAVRSISVEPAVLYPGDVARITVESEQQDIPIGGGIPPAYLHARLQTPAGEALGVPDELLTDASWPSFEDVAKLGAAVNESYGYFEHQTYHYLLRLPEEPGVLKLHFRCWQSNLVFQEGVTEKEFRITVQPDPHSVTH